MLYGNAAGACQGGHATAVVAKSDHHDDNETIFWLEEANNQLASSPGPRPPKLQVAEIDSLSGATRMQALQFKSNDTIEMLTIKRSLEASEFRRRRDNRSALIAAMLRNSVIKSMSKAMHPPLLRVQAHSLFWLRTQAHFAGSYGWPQARRACHQPPYS